MPLRRGKSELAKFDLRHVLPNSEEIFRTPIIV
jgi:hypothetical protein